LFPLTELLIRMMTPL